MLYVSIKVNVCVNFNLLRWLKNIVLFSLQEERETEGRESETMTKDTVNDFI